MKVYSIFILFFLALFSTPGFSVPLANSAWLYGKNEAWIKQIKSFNVVVPKEKQFNYLFPETAIVHVDSKNQKLIYKYDDSVTKFYKKNLSNVLILPDFSFWVAHTNFHHWSNASYITAADQIASYVNNDPNADGIFLDLESYSPSLIPFYQELAKDLKQRNKILSVIVRPGNENLAWFQVLGDNAFVVLYGYDLHQKSDPKTPVSPDIYENRLQNAITNIMRIAKQTKTPVMGGLPVVATTYEWEQKNLPHGSLKGNYKQIDYMKAALESYSKISSPLYMGYSVWAFVSDTNNKINIYRPYKISKDDWRTLIKSATKLN